MKTDNGFGILNKKRTFYKNKNVVLSISQKLSKIQQNGQNFSPMGVNTTPKPLHTEKKH